jgi:hypothetical protein
VQKSGELHIEDIIIRERSCNVNRYIQLFSNNENVFFCVIEIGDKNKSLWTFNLYFLILIRRAKRLNAQYIF